MNCQVKKAKRKSSKALKKDCDKLWANIIKMRAGNKSEIPPYKKGREIGGDAILNAHHICRKPNMSFRYDLENGICLTSWEHRYGIHGDHEEKYRRLIKEVRGQDIYERIIERNARKTRVSLYEVYDRLFEEHGKLSATNDCYCRKFGGQK
jgi:hypothetical protein